MQQPEDAPATHGVMLADLQASVLGKQLYLASPLAQMLQFHLGTP